MSHAFVLSASYHIWSLSPSDNRYSATLPHAHKNIKKSMKKPPFQESDTPEPVVIYIAVTLVGVGDFQPFELLPPPHRASLAPGDVIPSSAPPWAISVNQLPAPYHVTARRIRESTPTAVETRTTLSTRKPPAPARADTPTTISEHAAVVTHIYLSSRHRRSE